MPLFLSAAYLIELTLVSVTVRSCAACDMSHTSRLHCAICGRALPLILKYQSLQQQGKLTKRKKRGAQARINSHAVCSYSFCSAALKTYFCA